MEYRGFVFEIEKVEEGGYDMGVYDKETKWELLCEYNPSITKKEAIKDCKITVNDYYENPNNYI